MIKAHCKQRNTVYYHSCCNTFASKRFHSKHSHTHTMTLGEFLNNKASTADYDLAFKACVQASEKITGAFHLSSPTFNTPHQDFDFLNKRLQQAEERAAESTQDPKDKLVRLQSKIDQMEFKIKHLQDQLEVEKRRATENESFCMVYAYFLRYNSIDPVKVKEGWQPPRDHHYEQQIIRWPCFDFKPAAVTKSQSKTQ
jgi:tRNA G26 N,N-dimethylase Trm1